MKPIVLVALLPLALAACSALPPSGEEMAKLPVVRYGDTAPKGQDFVLFYPAGAKLPVNIAVEGSLLDAGIHETAQVTLKRDVYFKGPWLSFDGKTWVAGRDAVTGKIDFALPGVDDGKSPGRLGARFDLQ